MDIAGKLVVFILTGGNVNDSTQAQALIDETVENANGPVESITADKCYDSAAIVAHIEAQGAKAVIPSLSNRKVQRPVIWAEYKNRNLVEGFFARLIARASAVPIGWHPQHCQ